MRLWAQEGERNKQQAPRFRRRDRARNVKEMKRQESPMGILTGRSDPPHP